MKTEAWLHALGTVPVDHDVLDQVADVVIEGMTAIGGGPKNTGTRLMVLIKVMAIMLAGLRRTGGPEAEPMIRGLCDTLGGALEHEIHKFTIAAEKDERRAARAVRSVG